MPVFSSSLVLPQPGVPKGKLFGPLEFHSKIIENTVRRYWIYVPAKYDAKNPPNLLVFQDGQRAINPQGPLNIPVVLDNLIAKGDIPATLGIFITPGNTATEHYPDGLGPQGCTGYACTGNPNHRAQEYDAVNDTYARFLTEEMLPEVAKSYKFTDDPRSAPSVEPPVARFAPGRWHGTVPTSSAMSSA